MTAELIQSLMGAAIIGLVADHIRIRSMIAGFVTNERMERFETRIDGRFVELSSELQKIAGGLEYLRGRSGG